jgi:predicted dehydrogenase
MKVGFGIVGLGMIADFHARAIEATDRGALVACFSRSQSKADDFAARHGCKGYASMKAFLSHPGLEIVTVCTPSGAHMEPALAAADAGKHLIIEKPLEISLERCDRIIDTCARKKVILSGVFQSRFQDVSRLVKETIDSGRLGHLTLGDAYVKWYRTQKYYDEGGWHGTRRYDGGGALINQSIHAIDLLLWFMGPVEGVQAFAGALGHSGIEVEDTAVAALRFKSGALGVIEGSTAVFPGFLRRIEINGSRGSLVIVENSIQEWRFEEEAEGDDEIRQRFASAETEGGGASDPANIDFEGHRRQFNDVIRSVETGKAPMIHGEEARKAVELVLAIYRSAEEKRQIRLP